ncbi:MAG: PilZ domain-containing protein [Oscillospiraceae bacterium]|nr:PilZ domain-containing protein [Oscillospiraceae bacterium]
MLTENEKRGYIRYSCFYSDAQIIQGEDIQDIIAIDLSASGVKFILEKGEKYKLGDVVQFYLDVSEFAAAMEIKCDIKICRAEKGDNDEIIYGASFVDLSLSQSICLDEIILYKKRKSGFLPDD